MKRLLALFLVIVLVFSIAIPIHAAESEGPTPRYTHVNSIAWDITINKILGVINCYASVTAWEYLPVKVVCNLQVYKDGSWQTLKTWEASNNFTVSLDKRYAVASGYEYRMAFYGYVFSEDNVLLERVYQVSKTISYP